MENILVIGSSGQIGSALTPALQEKYGATNVIGYDINPYNGISGANVSIKGSVLDNDLLAETIARHKITQIYHLAAMLSASGEKNPDNCWELNLDGLKNVLNLAYKYSVRVFWPSSIAAFGPSTPKENTPQDTIMVPTTMYGITKVSGELLCLYYWQKFGVDVRSLRYPGLISWEAPPGGGTTDYAVAIFYESLLRNKYTCFVGPETKLPMMYMPDAIKGTLMLMETPSEKITIRTAYNFAAMSFTARELAQTVARLLPGFRIDYQPDHRQKIADSWPSSIDDSKARKDWGWDPRFGLEEMSKDMIFNLRKKLTSSPKPTD